MNKKIDWGEHFANFDDHLTKMNILDKQIKEERKINKSDEEFEKEMNDINQFIKDNNLKSISLSPNKNKDK